MSFFVGTENTTADYIYSCLYLRDYSLKMCSCATFSVCLKDTNLYNAFSKKTLSNIVKPFILCDHFENWDESIRRAMFCVH